MRHGLCIDLLLQLAMALQGAKKRKKRTCLLQSFTATPQEDFQLFVMPPARLPFCANSCRAGGLSNAEGPVQTQFLRAHHSEFADENQSSATKWQVPGSLLSMPVLLNGLDYIAFLVFSAEPSRQQCVGERTFSICKFPRISRLIIRMRVTHH